MIDRALAWKAGVVVAALLVAWRIVVVNGFLYDESGRPLLAPLAGADEAQLAAMLDSNAAQPRVLLAIGRERERRGDGAAAASAYESASALAPMAREVLLESAGFALRQGRADAAVGRLNTLVRNYEAYDTAFPVFAQLLAAREPATLALLARNPPWLGLFISYGCRREVEPALLASLLAARGTGAEQSVCVGDRLRAAGRWEEAYQVWLNTLPRERLAELGYVFNGSFEHQPLATGFDWRFTQGSDRDRGHTVLFAQAAGGAGEHALRVTYSGRRQGGPAVEEWLVLTPGRYVMTGLARMDKLSSVRGVQWAVRCADPPGDGQPIGVSGRFLGSSDWTPFAFDVAIPEGCRGQQLRLEAVGVGEGATYLAGTAWFDDLRLTRAPVPAPTPTKK